VDEKPAIIAPSPPLSGDVLAYFFVGEGDEVTRRRLVPDGSVDLLFNLEPAGRGRHGETTESPAAVLGVLTGPVEVVRPAKAPLFGVVLAPGAARAILGVPAHELSDRLANLDDVIGPKSAQLLDRLRAAKSTSEKAAIVDRFLMTRRTRIPPPLVSAAVLGIRRSSGRLPIDANRRELGVS